MFLVGGPAFSGTTLLALLLNQRDVVCLDEPDFGKPGQAHRGLPVLESLFPGIRFPALPVEAMTPSESFAFMSACGAAVRPTLLGIKTCNSEFIAFARLFKDAGHPVIAIVRDIRDALVRPLPEWIDERGVNDAYRLIWRNIGLADVWLRYEDLVRAPDAAMAAISQLLARQLTTPRSWDSSAVHGAMVKLPRHELLRAGSISPSRAGLWRSSGKEFAPETHETARMMGYDA